MPAFFAQLIMNFATWITGWFVLALPGIVARVLVVLGIGFVSFSGISSVSSELAGFITSKLSGLPADMLAILNLAGVGTGINIFISALTTYFTIKVALGAFSKFRTSPSSFRA
jgi:hypothetical protein